MELLFLIILLIIAIPTAYAAIIGAPLALTNKSQIQDIIKVADLREGEVFYELGTGTGRVITAISEIKGVKVVGFELSPLFYLIALIKLILKRRKNYNLFCKNFYKANLSQADVVFCFLMPKAMEKLKNKFLKELKPGAKVISYAFPITGWNPIMIIKKEGETALYLYQV